MITRRSFLQTLALALAAGKAGVEGLRGVLTRPVPDRPAETVYGPSLTVNSQPMPDGWVYIDYAGPDCAVMCSANGGAWEPLPPSGRIWQTRPRFGEMNYLTFRATKNGQTIDQSLVVPGL